MKFTKEEISLCKQVAEKHIKKVKYGEWYLLNGKPILCAYANEGFHKSLEAENKITPLWTISDCLEFLREKGFTITQACEHPMSNEWIIEVNPYFSNAVKIMGHKSFDVRGDTLLIACLKAVLAVLGKNK